MDIAIILETPRRKKFSQAEFETFAQIALRKRCPDPPSGKNQIGKTLLREEIKSCQSSVNIEMNDSLTI
jgi:hypothetical protein